MHPVFRRVRKRIETLFFSIMRPVYDLKKLR